MNYLVSICTFFGMVLSFYCQAQAPAPSPTDSLSIGGKEWRLRYKAETNETKILEFVTNSETINKWTELITFQKFKYKFPKTVAPMSFADKEIANIKEKGYKYTYTSFDSTPLEATIEFRILTPLDQQQDEIQRIVKTPDDELIVLHYAIKKSDMGDMERSKWVSVLKGIATSGLND